MPVTRIYGYLKPQSQPPYLTILFILISPLFFIAGWYVQPYIVKVQSPIQLPIIQNYQTKLAEQTEVILSYYTASSDETDNNPFITADGTDLRQDKKVVACNWLPFNTLVEIDGEVYRVADRMNRRYQKPYMDVPVETKAEAFRRGRQTKQVIIFDKQNWILYNSIVEG